MAQATPKYQYLKFERRGPIVQVTLDRPHAANALHRATIAELADALILVRSDPAVRALVLWGGTGNAFCAGGDLKERRENPGKDWEMRRPLVAMWQQFATLPKPIVIAANGHAAGGGFELMMLCHGVGVSESSEIRLP